MNEKIDALEAHSRFPAYRLSRADNGQVTGNIIVNKEGRHHPLDDHDKFESRMKDYLVGGSSVHVTSPEGIARGREETVAKLGEIFDKPSNRCFDIVPRHRKMTEAQIDEMHDWLTNLTK